MIDLRKAVVSVLLVAAAGHTASKAAPQVEVVATGLDNPRGFAFSPDGRLYVAEAGRAATATASGSATASSPATARPAPSPSLIRSA